VSQVLRVLLPYDGSPMSEAVVPYLGGLGSPVVTLLRVISPKDETGARVGAKVDADTAGGRLRAAGFDVHVVVAEGDPAATIAAVAAERGAGLIAMTTHGRSGFDRLVLGSVAERLIRSSPVPVLAIRLEHAPALDERPAPLFERIVLPYDGSELAWRAIETLALLGAAAKGTLYLYGVVDTLGAAMTARTPADTAEVTYFRERVRRLKDEVDRAVSRARDLGFDATGSVDVGLPAAKILDFAASLPATLVAMGTHGRSGFSRWALGSVTESVLRASDRIPLLIRR
jgi:nucleotide-binding universal stress UspA family protein